jgi:predicted Zn finger-like uncharacterized protein
MSIITQCPSCGTSFRVTPPQLQAQHGMVRCGRCAQVFDGFKTLATLPDTAAPDVSLSATMPAEPALQETPRDSAPVAAVTAAEIVKAAPFPVVEAPSPPPEIATVREAPAQAQEPVAVVAPPPYPASEFAAPPARRASGGWAFGVLLMLTGLAAQGAYFYRSEIAASVPEARPYLAKMCESLRCTVALPQRPRQISIEASDLQAVDPANPGLIALTATLRNQATTALGYPALDVVLTNVKEHTVARRIFLPAEYLLAGKDARAGIAPNAELTIRLDLDTGDLGAAGFRLDLIAAPAR